MTLSNRSSVTATSVSTRTFFFSSRRRHTRLQGDWSSDVCSSDLVRSSSATEEIAEDRKPERLTEGVEAEESRDDGAGLEAFNALWIPIDVGERSEERRVGKECRSRG